MRERLSTEKNSKYDRLKRLTKEVTATTLAATALAACVGKATAPANQTTTRNGVTEACPAISGPIYIDPTVSTSTLEPCTTYELTDHDNLRIDFAYTGTSGEGQSAEYMFAFTSVPEGDTITLSDGSVAVDNTRHDLAAASAEMAKLGIGSGATSVPTKLFVGKYQGVTGELDIVKEPDGSKELVSHWSGLN